MQVLNRVKFVSAVAIGLAAIAAMAQDSGRTFTPSDLQWKPSPRVPGLETVDVLGDSTKPGPIVYRVKFPANFHSAAHPS